MGVKAYAVQNTEGRRISILGTGLRVLAGTEHGASFSVMTADLPAGMGPPPHVHDDEDEAFFVIEGQMRFLAGADEWVLGPGGFVYLPRGIVHQPMVANDEAARAVVITSRPGLENFFAEFVANLARSGSEPSLRMLDDVGVPYGLHHFPPRV